MRIRYSAWAPAPLFAACVEWIALPLFVNQSHVERVRFRLASRIAIPEGTPGPARLSARFAFGGKAGR